MSRKPTCRAEALGRLAEHQRTWDECFRARVRLIIKAHRTLARFVEATCWGRRSDPFRIRSPSLDEPAPPPDSVGQPIQAMSGKPDPAQASVVGADLYLFT